MRDRSFYLRLSALALAALSATLVQPASSATMKAVRMHATGGPEVHADGEIWGQTLWDLRGRLTTVWGRASATIRTHAASKSRSPPPGGPG